MEPLTSDELKAELLHLTGWKLAGGNRHLYKRFDFQSYTSVIQFVNRIAAIAEEHNHHPEMTVTFGGVGVAFTTHDAGGLTKADFDAARAVDSLPR